MKYTVYILYSDKHDKHYTGYSTDWATRLKSHNEFGHGWTSRYRPWRIIFTKEFEDKAAAMLYEQWLKTGVGREFTIPALHQRYTLFSNVIKLYPKVSTPTQQII